MIETRKISELKKHAKNPRKMTTDQYVKLRESINRFGLIDKPIINIDGQIIGGHQRIEVLKKQGEKSVDCWVPDQNLDDKDIDDLNLIHNRVHGEFDYDVLANSYEVPDLIDCGFTIEELHLGDLEEIAEEAKPKKKSKSCPNCGHEF